MSGLCCCSCEGDHVFVGDDLGRVHMWNVSPTEGVVKDTHPATFDVTKDREERVSVNALCVLGDSSLWIGCTSGLVRLDLHALELTDRVVTPKEVLCLATLRGDPSLLVVGCADGAVYVHDGDAGGVLKTVLRTKDDFGSCRCVSLQKVDADRSAVLIFAGFESGTVVEWDLFTSGYRVIESFDAFISSIVVDSTSSWMTVAGRFHYAVVYSLHTKEKFAVLPTPGPSFAIAMDGDRVFLAGAYPNVLCFRLDGKFLGALHAPPSSISYCLDIVMEHPKHIQQETSEEGSDKIIKYDDMKQHRMTLIRSGWDKSLDLYADGVLRSQNISIPHTSR